MDAKHAHFMISVTLLEAEDAVKKARQHLETGTVLFTATYIKCAIQKLADAGEELFKKEV